MKKLLALMATASLVIAVSGCSFSESSKSSSKSIGASSKSIGNILSSPSKSSKSSSGGESEGEFHHEVADYTYAYVRSSSSSSNYESFVSGLGGIAAKHGVVDWESNSSVYVAVGRGLKKAKLQGTTYETYKKNLAGGDYAKMQDIQKGYDD